MPDPDKFLPPFQQLSRRQKRVSMFCWAIAGWGILLGIVALAIFLSPDKVTCSEAGTSIERAGFRSRAAADLFYAKKTAAGKTCTQEYR